MYRFYHRLRREGFYGYLRYVQIFEKTKVSSDTIFKHPKYINRNFSNYQYIRKKFPQLTSSAYLVLEKLLHLTTIEILVITKISPPSQRIGLSISV